MARTPRTEEERIAEAKKRGTLTLKKNSTRPTPGDRVADQQPAADSKAKAASKSRKKTLRKKVSPAVQKARKPAPKTTVATTTITAAPQGLRGGGTSYDPRVDTGGANVPTYKPPAPAPSIGNVNVDFDPAIAAQAQAQGIRDAPAETSAQMRARVAAYNNAPGGSYTSTIGDEVYAPGIGSPEARPGSETASKVRSIPSSESTPVSGYGRGVQGETRPRIPTDYSNRPPIESPIADSGLRGGVAPPETPETNVSALRGGTVTAEQNPARNPQQQAAVDAKRGELATATNHYDRLRRQLDVFERTQATGIRRNPRQADDIARLRAATAEAQSNMRAVGTQMRELERVPFESNAARAQDVVDNPAETLKRGAQRVVEGAMNAKEAVTAKTMKEHLANLSSGVSKQASKFVENLRGLDQTSIEGFRQGVIEASKRGDTAVKEFIADAKTKVTGLKGDLGGQPAASMAKRTPKLSPEELSEVAKKYEGPATAFTTKNKKLKRLAAKIGGIGAFIATLGGGRLAAEAARDARYRQVTEHVNNGGNIQEVAAPLAQFMSSVIDSLALGDYSTELGADNWENASALINALVEDPVGTGLMFIKAIPQELERSAQLAVATQPETERMLQAWRKAEGTDPLAVREQIAGEPTGPFENLGSTMMNLYGLQQAGQTGLRNFLGMPGPAPALGLTGNEPTPPPRGPAPPTSGDPSVFTPQGSPSVTELAPLLSRNDIVNQMPEGVVKSPAPNLDTTGLRVPSPRDLVNYQPRKNFVERSGGPPTVESRMQNPITPGNAVPVNAPAPGGFTRPQMDLVPNSPSLRMTGTPGTGFITPPANAAGYGLRSNDPRGMATQMLNEAGNNRLGGTFMDRFRASVSGGAYDPVSPDRVREQEEANERTNRGIAAIRGLRASNLGTPEQFLDPVAAGRMSPRDASVMGAQPSGIRGGTGGMTDTQMFNEMRAQRTEARDVAKAGTEAAQSYADRYYGEGTEIGRRFENFLGGWQPTAQLQNVRYQGMGGVRAEFELRRILEENSAGSLGSLFGLFDPSASIEDMTGPNKSVIEAMQPARDDGWWWEDDNFVFTVMGKDGNGRRVSIDQDGDPDGFVRQYIREMTGFSGVTDMRNARAQQGMRAQ